VSLSQSHEVSGINKKSSAIVLARNVVNLVKNDLHIGVAVIAARAPCRNASGVTESTEPPALRNNVMMHTDLIDQDDLRERLQLTGVQLPADADPEQACARALQGLDDARARALRSMIEQMLGSGATMLPTVREAISRQLLPALAEYQQSRD
jgi:hypothetical protein